LTIKSNIPEPINPLEWDGRYILVGDHLIADMKIYKSEKLREGIYIFKFPKDPSEGFIKESLERGRKVTIIHNKFISMKVD